MSSSGRPGLGALRRISLRDVVRWTLPPFVAALYWLGASVNDYRHMAQFDDWWSQTARVDRFAWWRVRSALRLPRALSLDHGLSVEDTERALVDLRVDRSMFDSVASDPVAHAGESVKAALFEGNSSQEVELKLRGDTSVHWSAEKKTLSLKSERGEMFHRSRVNVFSGKEVLPQFAANSMAADFDLLAPLTAVVPLFLNQRFNGMFRSFAPLDETFLRNAKRIPGNIFRGDTAERGDYFKGLPRELFVNPYIWDRVAFNDRPGAIGTAKLFEFVERVNRAGKNELPDGRTEAWSLADVLNEHVVRSDENATERLFEILDRGEIARLLALDLCVGDPWHSSGVHNHFWYEDSSSGLLHPIPWDLRMLDLANPPPNARFNRFWRAALRDPRVFATALEEIWKRNQDGKLLAGVTQRVEEVCSRYRDGFEFDRLRSGQISDVGTPEQVLGTLKTNLATLEGWCKDARASVAVTKVGDNESIVDILVDGRAGIELVGIALGAGRECTLTADSYPDGKRFIGDRAVQLVAQAEQLRVFEGDRQLLLPGVRAAERLESEGIHYRYYLQSSGPALDASAILLCNAITREPVSAKVLAPGSALAAAASVHPWSLREPSLSLQELSGEVRLSKTLVVPRNTTLRIRPGTHLVLDPDVSIHCKGRIEAQGSAESPITISSSDPRRPWGSFALLGAGADKSLFQHVHFSGGGGALLEEVEYTGMVCVHWARGVRFEDCEFSGNQRCDDALHADEADVTVSKCWFHDTNADALDFDISTGRIEHCKVERAGNDGFDLMTCSPEIVGNEIVDNRDKGISVGEDSSPFIFANTIHGCERGIEVKDRSSPVILNNTIARNRVGVMARLKNWRYERGGWPRLIHTLLSGNDADLVLAPTARLTALGSRIGGGGDEVQAAFRANSDWIYALHGIALDEPRLGAPTNWRTIPNAPIQYEEHFRDGWTAPGATWRRKGGATSVRIAADCLVVRMNAKSAQVSRQVNWSLHDATRTNWLVLETAGTDIKGAMLRVEHEPKADNAPALRVPLELGETPERYAFTVVPLPAGEYRSLTLEIDPLVRTELKPHPHVVSEGQIRLQRWFIVSASSADLEKTK